MADLVSVIIPTYNRRRDLCECIDSIIDQEYKPMEIIVVDDCSNDDTIDYLSSHYRDIIVIASNQHYGPAHLRNKGLIIAKGKYILFLDSDVVLHDKSIITRMVNKLNEDENVGQLGGEIPVNLGIRNWASGKKRDFFGGVHDVISGKLDSDRSKKKCDYLTTANCVVRREVAESVGGFDPYFVFGGEDVDFGYRIQNLGLNNYVWYDIAVQHKHSILGRYANESYRYKITRMRFNMKHFSLAKVLAIFLGDLLKALIFYLVLIPKITIKILTKGDLTSSNFLGGYHILKAYLINIINYSEIKETRNLNFLRKGEMDKYESQVATRRLK